MPGMLSYGEDGLTLWALTIQRQQLLQGLGDGTDAKDALVMFRPSFGRAGGPGKSQFGEFDGIIATREAVYLLESKWDGSRVVYEGWIQLQERQVLRHRIFRWIRTSWRQHRPGNWQAFHRIAHESFAAEFLGKPLASAGSPLPRLSSNLEFYLQRFDEFPDRIVDAVVYFSRTQAPLLRGVRIEESPERTVPFTIVPMQYSSLNAGGVFTLFPSDGEAQNE